MNWSRRQFIGTLGTAFAIPSFMSPLMGREVSSQVGNRGKSVAPIGTARNVIFIHLDGGHSHLDTFDLKTGAWTSDLLGPQTIKGYLSWPAGTMPLLAERTDKFSLIRSIATVEQDHTRAIFHMSTSYQNEGTNQRIVPHVGSMLSYLQTPEFAGDRFLPNSLSFAINVGEGVLEMAHRLGSVDPYTGYANLTHVWNNPGARFYMLEDQNRPIYDANDPRGFYRDTRKQAREMSTNGDLVALTRWDNAPQFANDTEEAWARQANMAVNILDGNMGTRFIELNYFNWDHHSNIYADTPQSLVGRSRSFDLAVAHMLDQLEARPGQWGGTLLDETLVVVMGEFGRTPGLLNSSSGRDHYPYAGSALVAGGGVVGGRIIGATNDTGALITDYGWSQGRPIGIADIVATMYSAVGIDFTTRIEVAEERIHLVDNQVPSQHITELFGEV